MDDTNMSTTADQSYSDGGQDHDLLRRDLDAALRHLHFMGMQSKHDLVDLTSRLYALMEEMVAMGQLDLRSFEERRLRLIEREEKRLHQRTFVQIDETTDKYALQNLPNINCRELMPICQGRCCQLVFPLSFQDLDERIVKWDYSAPYLIRRNSEGSCVHQNLVDGHCSVYEQRPVACRAYDCRTDQRIWADFERRILAVEALSGEEENKPAVNETADR